MRNGYIIAAELLRGTPAAMLGSAGKQDDFVFAVGVWDNAAVEIVLVCFVFAVCDLCAGGVLGSWGLGLGPGVASGVSVQCCAHWIVSLGIVIFFVVIFVVVVIIVIRLGVYNSQVLSA